MVCSPDDDQLQECIMGYRKANFDLVSVESRMVQRPLLSLPLAAVPVILAILWLAGFAHAGAAGPSGLIYINTSFENASPLYWETDAAGLVHVYLVYDQERASPNRANGHWFFEVQAAPNTQCTLVLHNLDNVWNGKRGSPISNRTICYVSEDARTWRLAPAQKTDDNCLKVELVIVSGSLYVARMEPYRLSDLEALEKRIHDDRRVRIATIGKTVQGRELEVIRVGYPNASCRVFLRARAHPWEAGGNWVVEGLVERLLRADADAERYLGRYCVYIMPMANKDGVARGMTRFNLRGKDLNRDWDKPADPALAPENAALEAWLEESIRAGHKPDLALDLHNDGGGRLHLSRPPVADLDRHLEKMRSFEALLRRHTWFTEGSTQPGFRNSGTLGDGWLERYGIDAAVLELNCNWIAGLKEAPLGRHWETFGAGLARVFFDYFAPSAR